MICIVYHLCRYGLSFHFSVYKWLHNLRISLINNSTIILSGPCSIPHYYHYYDIVLIAYFYILAYIYTLCRLYMINLYFRIMHSFAILAIVNKHTTTTCKLLVLLQLGLLLLVMFRNIKREELSICRQQAHLFN